MQRFRHIALVLIPALLLPAQEVSQSGLELQAVRPMVSQPERARHGMVATAHELASEVGVAVLRRGGNAVDAAVAVGFVLAVVHPEAGNLGGGGYMLVRMSDGRSRVIDYRETAPASATPDSFRAPEELLVGYKSVAVPGTVAGLALAHRLYGTRPWRELLEPARRLAKAGFPASHRMELILRLQVPVMKQFPETARVFLRGTDQPLLQGDRVLQPDLASTIERIQKRGWREFYDGETARLIAADMAANGGLITAGDLAGYRPVERDPIETTYRGHRVLTVPPSSAGGMNLIEMLNIVESFELKPGMEGAAESLHLLIEAMRRAFRDRMRFAGDPEFVEVPVERLIDKEYGRELAAGIHRERAATPAELIGSGLAAEAGRESNETTHFSIVDTAGNMVSNTYTLNGFFGSQVIAKGTGVLLNDIMAAFSRTGGRNGIAPGRRPVSSMTPTIVLRPDGRNWVALGSPGSLTIPNTVFQVIVNLIDFRMSLRDAIEFRRIHHQHQPNFVDAEPGALVLDVRNRLAGMGHEFNPKLRSQGDVHAVMLDESGWRMGWSDGRRGGRALGH
ncbi:MAG: gamma-glutamyltransferase [Bryobacteraceae bacterium]